MDFFNAYVNPCCVAQWVGYNARTAFYSRSPEGQGGLPPSADAVHPWVTCMTCKVMSSKEDPFKAVLGVCRVDMETASDPMPVVND